MERLRQTFIVLILLLNIGSQSFELQSTLGQLMLFLSVLYK